MSKDPFAEEPTPTPLSNICALVKGHENTLKTGIVLDCRSEAQINRHAKVCIIDPDNTAGVLVRGHWGGSDDFIIRNPVEFNIETTTGGKRKKVIDYEETFNNIYEFLIDIDEMMEEGVEIAGIVFEGLDILNTDAASYMRETEGLEVADGVSFNKWNIRNAAYMEVIRTIRLSPYPKYFTTHLKEYFVKSATKVDKKGEPAIVDSFIDANMGKNTKDGMLQIIECSKSKSPDGIITYNAHIEEFKSKPEFEGKDFTTMITGSGEFTYYGLGILRDDANVENRQLDALF
jgi:hypothetical protein